jgi:transposase-like protein
MQMLKCKDCERTFDESEIATWEESRGEFWGMPCTETMSGCPFCHSGDIEEYQESEDGDE